MSLEIERRFLIAMPDLTMLTAACERVYAMEQTYLKAEEGVTARVRHRVGVREEFFYTEKEYRTNCTSEEREREIDKAEYAQLLERRDEALQTISKRRFCLPHDGLIFEIDVYPFWEKVAVMEVELTSEEQPFTFPEGITVLKEVTSDRRMKNVALARKIPKEEEL